MSLPLFLKNIVVPSGFQRFTLSSKDKVLDSYRADLDDCGVDESRLTENTPFRHISFANGGYSVGWFCIESRPSSHRVSKNILARLSKDKVTGCNTVFIGAWKSVRHAYIFSPACS